MLPSNHISHIQVSHFPSSIPQNVSSFLFFIYFYIPRKKKEEEENEGFNDISTQPIAFLRGKKKRKKKKKKKENHLSCLIRRSWKKKTSRICFQHVKHVYFFSFFLLGGMERKYGADVTYA